MSGQNTSKDSFAFYLNSVAERLDVFIGSGASKKAFVKHVNKVIAEAKKYKKYLSSEYTKAKANNRIEYDEQADEQRLWYPTVDSVTSHIYFTEKVYFCLTEKLKPDPLEYLIRMASGAEEGQKYKGLDLIDYQFIFLAIIHDAQRWGAGNERYYFDIRDDEAESPEKASFENRIGIEVWKFLLAYEGISKNYVINTPNTIKAALQAVSTKLWKIQIPDEQEKSRAFGFGEWEQRKKKLENDRQVTTLKNFIETYCDLSAKPDIQSKVELLHEYNRKKKIKLPKLAKKYKRGQYKYYYVDDLKKNWAKYQFAMPTLPALKVPGK